MIRFISPPADAPFRRRYSRRLRRRSVPAASSLVTSLEAVGRGLAPRRLAPTTLFIDACVFSSVHGERLSASRRGASPRPTVAVDECDRFRSLVTPFRLSIDRQ